MKKLQSRRDFLKDSAWLSAALVFPATGALGNELLAVSAQPKISLAQWSLHRSLEKGLLKAADFSSIARNDFGIAAVEYVNGFYEKQAEDEKFWQAMKSKASDNGVESLLIMVDGEGDLGHPKDKARMAAVENHYKWIHAAKILGCHSIRVNAFGSGTRSQLRAALTDGLGKLAEYGSQEGIHVLIENHGLHTSDADFVVELINAVNNPGLGTLPDFGNWCMSKEWGGTKDGSCDQVYDPHKGLASFLPYAKGVSAKSYDFDPDGNAKDIDYPKLLKLVKDSGFNGYIGIEYEGEELSEPEGIRATKTLIERIWRELH